MTQTMTSEPLERVLDELAADQAGGAAAYPAADTLEDNAVRRLIEVAMAGCRTAEQRLYVARLARLWLSYDHDADWEAVRRFALGQELAARGRAHLRLVQSRRAKETVAEVPSSATV